MQNAGMASSGLPLAIIDVAGQRGGAIGSAWPAKQGRGDRRYPVDVWNINNAALNLLEIVRLSEHMGPSEPSVKRWRPRVASCAAPAA
jgi:hypothetical protein